MAKKKAAGTGTEAARSKQLGARIPMDLYKRLAHFTVDHEVQLKDALTEAIEDYLRKKRGA
jgi:hypothetical protein